jgi:hypothetical protein
MPFLVSVVPRRTKMFSDTVRGRQPSCTQHCFSCRRGNYFLYNVWLSSFPPLTPFVAHFATRAPYLISVLLFLLFPLTCLRRRSRLLRLRVGNPPRARNVRLLCLLCVVYVATSATGRSFVQRSPTGRNCVCVCVSLCTIYKLKNGAAYVWFGLLRRRRIYHCFWTRRQRGRSRNVCRLKLALLMPHKIQHWIIRTRHVTC